MTKNKKFIFFRFNATKAKFEYYCDNNHKWYGDSELTKSEIQMADKQTAHINEAGENFLNKIKKNKDIEDNFCEKEDEVEIETRELKEEAEKTESYENEQNQILMKLFEEQKKTNALIQEVLLSQQENDKKIENIQQEIYYLKYQFINFKEKDDDLNLLSLKETVRNLEIDSDNILNKLKEVNNITTEFFPE